MQQATQNTLLLDAIIASSKLEPPQCLHSKNVNRALDLLSFYSKEETKQQLLISCKSTAGKVFGNIAGVVCLHIRQLQIGSVVH